MNWKRLYQRRKKYFHLSAKGWLIYFVSMGLASLLCLGLRQVSTSDVHVPILFVLVVLVVSLSTDGYFYGILAALTPVRFLTDAAKIRKLRYVATDRRLMVVSEGAARSAAYGRIDQAAFRTDADGVTSLLCGALALAAKENKRREIAVIGMVGGDRAGEDQPIESFGFYSLSKQDVGALRGIMKQQCPALKL